MKYACYNTPVVIMLSVVTYFFGTCIGQPVLAGNPVKNWQILLVLSYIMCN